MIADATGLDDAAVCTIHTRVKVRHVTAASGHSRAVAVHACSMPWRCAAATYER